MPTVARLTERHPNLVELVLRNSPDISAFQVGAANSLDAAFAGTTSMFTLARASTFRSISVRKKKWGLTQYENRGLARAHYDPEDFWVGGGSLPHDAEGSYLRVSEVSESGVIRPEGPILIVPPPGYFVNTRPNLTVSGTAPDVAVTATGNPPAGALHFVLPRFADSVTIGNRSGAETLYVSFNAGLPEFQIPFGETVLMPDAGISDVFVHGDGGPVPFTAYFAVVNAEMA